MADTPSGQSAANSQSQSPPKSAADASESRSTQELIAERRRKLERIRSEFGLDPFGQRIDGLTPLSEARARYDAEADAAQKADANDDRRPRVRVAGRIVQHRVLGNLIFMRLRDHTGDLQVAVSKKQVPAAAFKLAKLAELSDLVAAEGPLGTTKTGEVTVWAEGQESGQVAEGSSGQGEEKAAVASTQVDSANAHSATGPLGHSVTASPLTPPASPSPPSPLPCRRASGTACKTRNCAIASATWTCTPTPRCCRPFSSAAACSSAFVIFSVIRRPISVGRTSKSKRR